jgi:hypothetical protein
MMKRSEFADTLPLVLLGLMTLVGGLGGGMRGAFDAASQPRTTAPPWGNFTSPLMGCAYPFRQISATLAVLAAAFR